ncbi:homoserine dehydrogenase [Peribacillus simplex]|uniref:homoserine dehydrogenase n=1 Tax=Peribacillus simplex TaxID=1478 RepID=UPI0010BF2AFC|nr:homoserine dehydrogenase [Peribacillus simplex]TKH03461.1 homoserine dehydrogenase [Peribacillus simplex]
MQKKIILTGYGTVAKELIKLIIHNEALIKEKYGFDLLVTGIVGSKGMIYEEKGIELSSLIEFRTGSEALSRYSECFQRPFIEPIFQGNVLIECTPTNKLTGEPALGYIKKAITNGMDIVSVSKGALVKSFDKIKTQAAKHGSRLKYSGATAAALPTLDIGEYSLAGCTITRIEGILNGTSNFILGSMSENNLSFKEALKIAQEKGIAEANPSLDVQGFDTACKILLLANGFFGSRLSIDDVKVKGIELVTKEEIKAAKQNGRMLKLLGSAYKEAENVIVEVKPSELESEHPLAHVNGTNKGVVYETIEMGAVCATGGASHPRGAAAAALKDVINLYRGISF